MYYFRDYDDINERDLSISSDDYINLIKCCIRNCKYFTLSYANVDIEQKINCYIKPIEGQDLDGRSSVLNKLYVYPCTDETEQFLIKHVNDLFEWSTFGGYGNPEDVAFYREDGTIFFWSETHEGICAIFNHNNEDVSDIVKQAGWNEFQENNSGFWNFLKNVQGYSIRQIIERQTNY